MRILMAAALVGGVALAGCGDDSGKNTNKDMHAGDGFNGDGGNGDGGPNSSGTFEAFVLDQIQNHTNETGKPVDYTTMTFTTPDNTDPAFFSSLFP